MNELICEAFATNSNMAFMYSSCIVCQKDLHAYKEKAHLYNLIKIFCLDEHFVIVSMGQIIIHHNLHFMLKDVAFWCYVVNVAKKYLYV